MTVVLLVAWVGSAWVYVRWSLVNASKTSGCAVTLESGCLSTAEITAPVFSMSGASWGVRSSYEHFRWGFQLQQGATHRVLTIPLWCPFLIALSSTTIAWRPDLLAARRAWKGYCVKCAYDRAGLPPDAPCPECGHVPIALKA